MSSISAALGQSAGGISFEHGGRTYSVSLVTQDIKSLLEKRLTDKALTVLERFRDILPAKEFAEESRELFREVKAGRYAFHGDLCQAALSGPESVFFFASMLGISEAELEKLVNEAGPKILAAIAHARALSESSREGDSKNAAAAAPSP